VFFTSQSYRIIQSPDGYIATLADHQPSYPILVSDFKTENYEGAKAESLAYYQYIATSLQKDIVPALFKRKIISEFVLVHKPLTTCYH